MDAAGCCVNAVVVAIQSEQLPFCESEIVDEYCTLQSVSNLKDMDGAAVATSLPRDQPINHKSQIFVRTCNRSIILNVNLASDSVQEVKRLVEEREGIPVPEQHLIFGGKPLRNGTFLRDYDALGDQCTLNVYARIRGGNRSQDMSLSALVEALKTSGEAMTYDVRIPGEQGPQGVVKALTENGRRVLHGVLTCILSAHEAGLSFCGACGMDNLMAHVYQGQTELVVSRVYVNAGGGQVALAQLDGETQKKDYVAVKKAIRDELFPGNDVTALHVESIYRLLRFITGGNDNIFRDHPVKRRTHLLQAYTAMVSSPVAVSTMCLNLKRFYDQLEGNRKTIFEGAMQAAQGNTPLEPEIIGKQPLFEKVYYYERPRQNNNNVLPPGVPNSQYAVDSGMEAFNFARNWFTHVPKERWDNNTERFQGLPDLDQIFTYHFPSFIPGALLQLYMIFDDYKLLTNVLVPFAMTGSMQANQ